MRVKKTKIFYFIVGFILALGVAQYWIFQGMAAKQLNHVHKQMKELNGMVKVDNLRTENINKVLSVLNRFNPSMSHEQKLAVASEICDASMKYANLDVDLLCATITHESAFTWNPQVVSHAGAMGLMQVMPETGKIIARIEGIQWTKADDVLFNPVLNIRLGSRYLSSLIELYDIDGGLAAYNGGGKRVELWLAHNKARGILYRETQNYVPAILSLYEEFRN